MKSLVIWSGDRAEKVRIKNEARAAGYKNIRCMNPTFFDGVVPADAFVAEGKIAEAYRAAGVAEYASAKPAKAAESKPSQETGDNAAESPATDPLPEDWKSQHYKVQIKLANERGADVETAADARAFLEGVS